MKVISSSYSILTPISEGGIEELKRIELAARTCYKSEDKIDESGESAKKLVRALISSGHEAMLEHGGMTVGFICDRGVSHELVRHRVASFAQESTRYCNYSKDKFGNELTFILPQGLEGSDAIGDWREAMMTCEETYLRMIAKGVKPEVARSVLPNSLKTEIVVTANWREWRHIFELRCAKAAHPDIRKLMIDLLLNVSARIPVLFDDICQKIADEENA